MTEDTPPAAADDDFSRMSHAELLEAARREQARAIQESANVDRATANLRAAEDQIVAAKEREREARRHAERVADNDRSRIGDLENKLRIAREAAAEMRGRLREARSNQMVRRGDIATNPYASPDDEVPF